MYCTNVTKIHKLFVVLSNESFLKGVWGKSFFQKSFPHKSLNARYFKKIKHPRTKTFAGVLL